MRAHHQEIVVADLRRAAFGAAAMNCTVFANDVAVSDLDLGFSFR